jgi:hypothetical protein
MSSTPEYAFAAAAATSDDGTGGMVVCFTCHERHRADEVHLDALRRTEGASDPDDMVAVAALTCPHCGAKGTVAFKYGPEATPEESEVLRLLDDRRCG